MKQKIFTKAQRAQLVANHCASEMRAHGHDPKPVIKLFCPWGAATWLLTEYDPETRLFFGLCDLGMQCPELGYVGREELESSTGPAGLTIERDLHFKASKTLSEYADEARELRRIAA